MTPHRAFTEAHLGNATQLDLPQSLIVDLVNELSQPLDAGTGPAPVIRQACLVEIRASELVEQKLN